MNHKKNIHLLMLGDSVFDNGTYVPGEPDVKAQVSERLNLLTLPTELTFKALDGAVMMDVLNHQIQNIPDDTTHIALSIGGNDLLGLIQYLGQKQGDTFQHNLVFLSQLKQKFSEEFQKVIQEIDSLKIPFTVCSIYYAGSIVEEGSKRVELGNDLGFSGTDVVVDAFDAAITEVAEKAEYCRELIDLRWLFDHSECYANPIEPSCIGGEKIADRLIEFIQK